MCLFAQSAYVENFEAIAKFLRSQKFDIAEKNNTLYTVPTEKLPTGIKLADSESRTEIQEGVETGIIFFPPDNHKNLE